MSSARSRHSLGGNHRLVENPVAKLGLEGCWRHEVDGSADAIAQLALQTCKRKQTNRPLELDKKVDIAVLAPFVASKRTEQRKPGNAERVQQRLGATQGRQDVVTSKSRLSRHRNHFSAARRWPIRVHDEHVAAISLWPTCGQTPRTTMQKPQ